MTAAGKKKGSNIKELHYCSQFMQRGSRLRAHSSNTRINRQSIIQYNPALLAPQQQQQDGNNLAAPVSYAYKTLYYTFKECLALSGSSTGT